MVPGQASVSDGPVEGKLVVKKDGDTVEMAGIEIGSLTEPTEYLPEAALAALVIATGEAVIVSGSEARVVKREGTK